MVSFFHHLPLHIIRLSKLRFMRADVEKSAACGFCFERTSYAQLRVRLDTVFVSFISPVVSSLQRTDERGTKPVVTVGDQNIQAKRMDTQVRREKTRYAMMMGFGGSSETGTEPETEYDTKTVPLISNIILLIVDEPSSSRQDSHHLIYVNLCHLWESSRLSQRSSSRKPSSRETRGGLWISIDSRECSYVYIHTYTQRLTDTTYRHTHQKYTYIRERQTRFQFQFEWFQVILALHHNLIVIISKPK